MLCCGRADIVGGATVHSRVWTRLCSLSISPGPQGEMAKLFSGAARAVVSKVVDPAARWLVACGLSANVVTVVGTAGVVAGSVVFVVRGQLLPGLVVITLSTLTDLLDGAMARQKGAQGRFGALLDSTMDRLADGAVFASLAYWLAISGQQIAAAGALVSLVAAGVVSYVKSRAESLGVSCDVGIAERAERLVLLGVGTILTLAGTPYAMTVTVWVLAALTMFTVAQRMWHVRRPLNEEAT